MWLFDHAWPWTLPNSLIAKLHSDPFGEKIICNSVHQLKMFAQFLPKVICISQVCTINTDFSTMDFPTPDFSTPDLGLKSPGLESSWLKSPGLKGLGLKLGVEMSFNHTILCTTIGCRYLAYFDQNIIVMFQKKIFE